MTSDSLRISRVAGLALVVGVFFTAEEVFMSLAEGHASQIWENVVNGAEFWVVWALLTPAVLFALRRWPLDARPTYRPLLAHAVVALFLAALHNAVLELLAQSFNPVAFVWGVFTGMVFYSVIAMVYTVVRFRSLFVAEQVSAAALEAELTQTKLDTLRSQLRPHFLFNTLNAISVFMTEDAGKAQQMLFRLSTLLRRSLDEEAHEVPLRQELAYVNDYLDIQRGRFGDRLVVHVAVDDAVREARVPVFLLQPLLENAIEHGKSDDRTTTITLTAGRDGDRLAITLVDDGPGVVERVPQRQGIGIGNTRARLHHLYGQRATLELCVPLATPHHGTRVEILIPLRETSA
ncbi:MAG TPA: histidine kinase [Gemmatimonadales bacterium]|nr:histidine kinase [Gemmatimonadales bacterium]